MGRPGRPPCLADARGGVEYARARSDARTVAKEQEGRLTDKPLGFVALKSIREGPADSQAVLAEIRQIYFKTTKRTIQHDIVHAIELLKSLPTEEERDKAAVYMEGLAQMRAEWARAEKKKRRK
jgi:hypothetical protein